MYVFEWPKQLIDSMYNFTFKVDSILIASADFIPFTTRNTISIKDFVHTTSIARGGDDSLDNSLQSPKNLKVMEMASKR